MSRIPLRIKPTQQMVSGKQVTNPIQFPCCGCKETSHPHLLFMSGKSCPNSWHFSHPPSESIRPIPIRIASSAPWSPPDSPRQSSSNPPPRRSNPRRPIGAPHHWHDLSGTRFPGNVKVTFIKWKIETGMVVSILHVDLAYSFLGLLCYKLDYELWEYCGYIHHKSNR